MESFFFNSKRKSIPVLAFGITLLALSGCGKSVTGNSEPPGASPSGTDPGAGGGQTPVLPGPEDPNQPPPGAFNGNQCQVYDLEAYLIKRGCIERATCTHGHCFTEVHAPGTAEWTACRSLPNLDVTPLPGAPADDYPLLLGVIEVRWFDVRDRTYDEGFPYFPDGIRESLQEYYALNCGGWMNIPAAGDYDFLAFTSGAFRFVINGVSVISNEIEHGPEVNLNTVALVQGMQHYRIHWYHGMQEQLALTLYWKSVAMDPLADYVVIPPEIWFRAP